MPALMSTLREHDYHWLLKFVFRTITLVFGVIAIGLLAATLSNNSYTLTDGGLAGGALVPLGLSVIWCFLYMLLQVLRKRPVHPGFPVAFDLILWMALLVFAGFVNYEGSAQLLYPDYYDSAYYDCASNSDSGNDSYGSTGSSYGYGYNGYSYDDDNCISPALRASVHHWSMVELAGGAFLSIVGLLEIALFIWACVDCSRYRRSRVSRQANEIAQSIIAGMVERGQLPATREPLMTGAAGAPVASAPAPAHNTMSEKQREVGGAAGYYAPQPQPEHPANNGVPPAGQDWAYGLEQRGAAVPGPAGPQQQQQQNADVHPALRPSQDAGARGASADTARPESAVMAGGGQSPQVPEVNVIHAQ